MPAAILSIFLTLQLFTLPTIPEAITASADRALYLAEHYWDNTPLSDTLVNEHPEEFEQFLADYLTILPLLSAEQQASLLRPLFAIATPQLRRYLAEEQSPVSNPDIYRHALCSLVRGLPQLEVHLIYRHNCDACLKTMELIDKSDIVRRSQSNNQLTLRMLPTSGDPQLKLYAPDGTCLANDISVPDLELLLLELSKNKESFSSTNNKIIPRKR